MSTTLISSNIGPLAFRKIIPKLTSEGYGIILPEMLGYGETARPVDLKEYSYMRIIESVAGIVAYEKVEKVILLGHDWVSVLFIAYVLNRQS